MFKEFNKKILAARAKSKDKELETLNQEIPKSFDGDVFEMIEGFCSLIKHEESIIVKLNTHQVRFLPDMVQLLEFISYSKLKLAHELKFKFKTLLFEFLLISDAKQEILEKNSSFLV
jgi:hypothetical protein